MADAAAKLKEEGNAHFSKKEYSQAYDKYTSALKKGGENAILYANRAACCMGLGKYLDARSDAQKATELDPKYTKAWGRLAAAEQEIGSWHAAIPAFEKALELLPKKNLSPAEKKQKEQYEAGLEVSKRKNKPKVVDGSRFVVRKTDNDGLPWNRAKEYTSHSTVGPESSAWMILEAYESFSAASRDLKQIIYVKDNFGRVTGMTGRKNVLESFSNAIIMDARVFHMDGPKWLEEFNKQVIIQSNDSNAWKEGGPEFILEDAQRRVRTLGWDHTRHALSITIRAWVMRAFLSAGVTQNYPSAIQFYEWALEIIERGRKIWRDVSTADRGVVFEDTFIRGIRLLLNQAYMGAISQGLPNYSVEKLLQMAEDLYEATIEARETNDTKYPPGFFLAFFVYPAADSLAVKAFCHKMKAKGKPIAEATQLTGESAELYWYAALEFPEDDEACCTYITTSLQAWWTFDDVTLRTVLPLLAKLKTSYPKMLRIWERTAASMAGRDEKIKKCLDYYEEVQKKMESGELNEDSVYLPQFRL